jgi:hypothetical protein
MQKEMKFGKEMPGKERETNRKPSLAPARLFRFLLTVYTVYILRYNAINMINTETRLDIGYVTISKRKLRQLIEAINAGAKIEDVKTELERMIE